MVSWHFFVHVVSAVFIALLLQHILSNKQREEIRVNSRDVKHTQGYKNNNLQGKEKSHPQYSSSNLHSTVDPNLQELFRNDGSNVNALNNHQGSPLSSESSVWCTGKTYFDRMCRFKNLCYNPMQDQFVFVHGDESVYHGLPDDRFDPALLDLSTVQDHNMQYFNYVDLPLSSLAHFNVNMVEIPSVIMKRFHPDNIMHVLHDDLLPLYHTLMMLTGEIDENSNFDFQLVFMEGWESGLFLHLYKLFSPYEPLFKMDIQKHNNLTCFKNAYFGLLKDTLWYQYGFKVPQSPLSNLKITSRHIRQFTNFVLSHFKFENNTSIAPPEKYAVLISRQTNRRILNEIDLTLVIALNLKVKVVTVALETHDFPHIISLISGASFLVGMHGSLMTLAMFLKPGSTVIELFPYAVPPENYTPYKTLCNLKGMDLTYKSWRNRNSDNTVTYPDESWDVGGIAHLSQEEQTRIFNSREVPQHLCCRDPHWLFRIYQDTFVDITSFVEVLQEAFDESKRFRNNHNIPLQPKLFPSNVANITCQNTESLSSLSDIKSPNSGPSFLLLWQQPWNLKYFNVADVKYEIWIQEFGQASYSAFIVKSTKYLCSDNLKKGIHYLVWIRCILNGGSIGPFNSEQIICST